MLVRIRTILPLLLLACVAQAQNSVELRSSVRLDHDQPLTLGTLAVLRGPLIEPLDGLELSISDDERSLRAGGWVSIEPDRVRSALAQSLGERAAVILVRGGPTHVRRLGEVRTETIEVAQETPEAVIPDATAWMQESTVRGHVARRIVSLLGARPEDVRLSFSDRDEQILQMSTLERVVDARPMGMGARMPIAVKVYQGAGVEGSERILVDTVVRVEVLVRQQVAVLNAQLLRGRPIVESDLTSDWQWLPPDTSPLTTQEASGRVARTTLQPGTVLRSSQVESAVVVKRGDIVLIDVLAGTVVVTVEARARQEARVGDVIEFEFKDDRRRTLQATVQSAGRAVSSASGAPAPTVSRESMR